MACDLSFLRILYGASCTPDEIAPVLKRALEIEGPVLIGVHVDHRDDHMRLCIQKQHRLTAPDASTSWISSSKRLRLVESEPTALR